MPKIKSKKTIKSVKSVKSIKKVLVSDVLKKAETLPPNRRKNYLKKFAVSFFKGAALAAGVATATALIYKVNKKNINNEVRTVINMAGDELRNEARKTSPIIQTEMDQILVNLQPKTDHLVETAVKKGFIEGKEQLKKHKPFLNETVEELGANAAKGAAQGTGGIMGLFTGQGGERKKPTYQREHKNINESNILPRQTRSAQKVLNNKNNAATIIQSNFRRNLAKRELEYKKELKKHKESKPFLGIFKGPAPIKGPIYNRPGIQQVKFGKIKKELKQRLLKKHLNLLKKIK